ncbi:type I secretion system ATPase [Tolumonas auensis DSM 9187]|uniref:Type I secretion system ATPase n=1 Tax=Tolumonas auensis (strain DSM 9187 / NBRC 110442 / TA 4) TaxID=595494 RepID=C4LE55_TOLAT|nr:type I secretion system permease/ATPase [Tolumonas auensis]ACQ92876.1 type I secretion system ATPase [Tolumonas auensis DSM 9187]NCB59634.1 type I secretion system permease/ATPase [Gammaproteobacteria bacterium]
MTMANGQHGSLLECLLFMSQHYGMANTREALTAGLPLKDGMLTPELFPRAAHRAGFVVDYFASSLEVIPTLLLPCILLMKDGRAAVLISVDKDASQAVLFVPVGSVGQQTIPFTVLENEFSGHGFYIKRRLQFDDRAPEVLKPREGHWFWSTLFESLPIYKDVLIASILINVFAVASPIFIMNVYDKIVPNLAFDSLWVLAIGVSLIFSFDLIIRQLRSYFIDIAGKKSDLLLSAKIFSKVLGIRLESRPNSTGAFARHLHEFESIREFFTSATVSALIDLPFAFLFLLVIWIFAGVLAVVPLIAIIIMIVYSLYIQAPLRHSIEESSRLAAQKYATVIEALAGLESVKIHNAEGQFQHRWEQAVSHMANVGIETRKITNMVGGLASYVQQMTMVAIVVLGVYEISEGNLSMGGMIAAVMLSGRAIGPLIQLSVLSTRYNQAKSALLLLENIMQSPSEREDDRHYLDYDRLSGRIELDDVSFNYPDIEQAALKHVTLNIQPGEKIAIIGRIGAGKTTLEKLILGLYKPIEGAVRLDGFELPQLHPSTVRNNIGCVPQDFSLFYGTIRQNIQLGHPHATDAQILRAAQRAGVSQFTNHDPNGLERQVGESGRNLSGGQRQSIALARAMLLDPPILILDEPTANMDNRSESIVKRELANLPADTTMLLITHRTSMLDIVNRIIVLEQGMVVADGPRDLVLQQLKEGKVRVRENNDV